MKSTETLAQQAFLKKQRRRRLFVAACRVFLLLFLLLLWESCARIGIIDDFIFSSPSRVAESLISMTMDRSLFLHTGITVAETLISLFDRHRLRDLRRSPLMVQPDAVRNPGALSRDAEQPPQIRPGSHPDRLAGKQYPDGDRRRRFRRRIRLHFNFYTTAFPPWIQIRSS